jgi:hypothetical protein
MEHHKRLAAAVAVAGLLLAACSDDAANEASAEDIQPIEEPEPEAVEPEPDPPDEDPEPEPEPETSEIDITVVPDEITEEYVEAVLTELEQLYSEAFATYVSQGEVTIAVNDRMGEAFTEDQREARIREFESLREGGFEGILPSEELRARDRSVLELIQHDDRCIYAETVLDFAGVLVDPPEPGPSFVLLIRQNIERPVDLNSSGWVLADLKTGDAAELREQLPC